jgi:2-haloacid dehalogenase
VLASSFSDLGRELGRPVSDADARLLGCSVPDWPAFDDSAQALQQLAASYRLIILSNVDRRSFAGSQGRLGVDFDTVITAEDLGVYKPDPGAFDGLLHVTSEMGIRPDRLLHVAQSMFHDHLPAMSNGLSTVWINRRHDRSGWGATPAPASMPTPEWEFTSMAAFVAASSTSR